MTQKERLFKELRDKYFFHSDKHIESVAELIISREQKIVEPIKRYLKLWYAFYYNDGEKLPDFIKPMKKTLTHAGIELERN